MHGIVACGHPLTAAAALEMLEEGGNAFDAALAAVMTSCVAEPLLGSLAGGGFLMAETGLSQRTLFDFFSQTPGTANPEAEFYPIHGDFGAATQEFHIGAGSIAVPGLTHGLFTVHAALGTLPFSRVAEPAVRAAREGVRVNPFQAHVAEVLEPIVTAQEPIRALFAPDGNRIQQGDLQVQSELADTLESLGREGLDLFYRGEIAQGLIDLCRDRGGHLTLEDLDRFSTVQREPLASEFNGSHIHTNPVPSSGGSLITHTLRLLEGLRSANWQSDPDRYLGLLPHVMNATNLERVRSGLQREPGPESAAELLDSSVIAELINVLEQHRPAYGGTTHISVMDNEGNVAATTLSNGEGCGYLLPGTGIHLNNFLGEQDLMPEGFDHWTPDRRLSSMMAPTIVDRPDGGKIALGSGGSNRLRSAIAQVLVRMVTFGEDAEQAVHAPRMHLEEDCLSLEPGFDPRLVDAIARDFPGLHEWDRTSLFFGGVHVVSVDADGLFDGCGDPRRGGVVEESSRPMPGM